MPALHISKPQKRKVQGEVSDYWYVRVTKSDGRRTWRTTATTDYKEAQEYRKKLFDDLAKEEKKLARRSLGPCLDEWLASKEPRVVESSYRTIEHKVKLRRSEWTSSEQVFRRLCGAVRRTSQFRKSNRGCKMTEYRAQKSQSW